MSEFFENAMKLRDELQRREDLQHLIREDYQLVHENDADLHPRFLGRGSVRTAFRLGQSESGLYLAHKVHEPRGMPMNLEPGVADMEQECQIMQGQYAASALIPHEASPSVALIVRVGMFGSTITEDMSDGGAYHISESIPGSEIDGMRIVDGVRQNLRFDFDKFRLRGYPPKYTLEEHMLILR